MKTIHYLLSAFVLAAFLASCTSEKNIQLVGHYKPNTDVSKAQSTTASNKKEKIEAIAPKSNMQAIASSGEAAPDLKLSEKQFQTQQSPIVLTQKQQTKADKLFQKIETKLEKKTTKLNQQSQLSQNLTAAPDNSGSSSSLSLGWLILFAILLPPLAVGLAKGIGTQFWISIILTLLFWIPGVIYALIVILK